MKFEDYSIHVSPLPTDEGGGFLVTIPDLPGCVADGATIDEALVEARDAFATWTMAEREARGHDASGTLSANARCTRGKDGP